MEINEGEKKTIIISYVWHERIPFKASFAVWRALKRKLLTNEKLTIF